MDDSLLEDLCGFLDREPDTEEIEWAYGNLELDLEAPDGVPNGIHDFTVDGDDSRVFHGIVVEEGKFDPHMSAHAVYLAQVARHGRAQLAPMYIRLLEWRWLDLYHGRFQVLVGELKTDPGGWPGTAVGNAETGRIRPPQPAGASRSGSS